MSSEIQFCVNCSNLLYPKEDVEHKQLIFLCRSCDHLQYADPYSVTQNCVDRINYNFRSKEDVNSYIAQGLDLDPTLPRASEWKCPNCPNIGAVYFQLPERVADDAMTLVFVCTECTFYQVKGKEISNDIPYNLGDESMNALSERLVNQETSNATYKAYNEDRHAAHLEHTPVKAAMITAQLKDLSPTQQSDDHDNLMNEKFDVDIGLDELGLGSSDDEEEEEEEEEKDEEDKHDENKEQNENESYSNESSHFSTVFS